MADPNAPPWEDDEPSSASGKLVTQDQHLALLRMVKDLEAKVRLQATQIAALLEGRSNSAKPDNSQGEKLQSGKHAGQTRDWVVKNAPDYLVYLDDNGWATTRWGFTAEQIAAARANPLLPTLQKRR